MTHPTPRLGGAVIALVALALTGCAGSGTDPGAGGTAAKTSSGCEGSNPSGTPSGKITFQTTNLKKDFAPFFDRLIADFEKTYPGTDVTWIDDPGDSGFSSRLLSQARNCDLPDVVNVTADVVNELNKTGNLVDFDKAAPDAGDIFVPTIWDSVAKKTNATHPALPWYWGPAVQVYNTELWQKAGLGKPPATVNEFLDAALKVGQVADGKYYAILGNRDWDYLNDWQSLGVALMNDDQTKFTFADDPKASEYLSKLAEIYKAGGMRRDSVTGEPDPSNDYAAGTLVWGSTNASFLRYLEKNAPQIYAKTDVAPAPTGPDGSVPFSGQYISVPTNSKNQGTAVAFAQFLTNDANQLAWSKDPAVVIFPTTTEALKDPYFTQAPGGGAFAKARAVAAAAALKAKADPAVPYFSGTVSTAITKAFQQAITGQKPAKDALMEAQDAANASLGN